MKKVTLPAIIINLKYKIDGMLNHVTLTQVRVFDSQHYLKAFKAGDVWVVVGWSGDVIPTAKTMSNIAVVVPKSGASLWADFWV